jgi:hypothetical protein
MAATGRYPSIKTRRQSHPADHEQMMGSNIIQKFKN